MNMQLGNFKIIFVSLLLLEKLCFSKHLHQTFDVSTSSWTSWSRWSSYSRTCGSGSRSRTRRCKTVLAPLFQRSTPLERCFGKTYEEEKCLLRPCPLTTDEVEKAFSIEQPMIDPGTQIECFTDEGFKSRQSIADSRKKRSGDGNVEKWTDGIVPYILDDSLKDDDRLVFARAISEISLHTCIQFVNILPLDYTEDVETESPYILVERDCDCDGLIPCTGGGRTDGLGVESPRRLIISTGCLSPYQENV